MLRSPASRRVAASVPHVLSRLSVTACQQDVLSHSATSPAHPGGRSVEDLASFRDTTGFNVASRSSFTSVAVAAAESPAIPFPREGPGVDYALNWALAARGVTPAGTVQRNLKPDKLAALKDGPKPASSSKPAVLLAGSPDLPAGTFNKGRKEVTAYLSSLPSLFVQDAAVGSSSASEARVRVISDSPAAAAALSKALCRTATRDLTAQAFPITVYVAAGLGASSLGASVIAADAASASILVLGGAASASSSAASLLPLLAALAAPLIASQGGLPLLGGRLIPAKSGSALLLSPPSIAPLSTAGTADVAWPAGGVARLLPSKDKAAPNLLPHPKTVVIVTSDSTKALPPTLKLSPSQAAFYFLAGFDGTAFNPALLSPEAALPSPDPLLLAHSLAARISESGASPILLNVAAAGEGDALLTSVLAGKVPAAKKPDEAAATELRSKFQDFLTGRFGELPAGIGPEQ